MFDSEIHTFTLFLTQIQPKLSHFHLICELGQQLGAEMYIKKKYIFAMGHKLSLNLKTNIYLVVSVLFCTDSKKLKKRRICGCCSKLTS